MTRIGFVGTENSHTDHFIRFLNTERRHPGYTAEALAGGVSERNDKLKAVGHDDLDLPAFETVDQQLAQLTDFVTAVQHGATPLVTSTQARAAVAFIEAAYTSARTGQPVKPR